MANERTGRPLSEDAIRRNRSNRPRRGPLKNRPVPILGGEQEAALDMWWIGRVSPLFRADLENWMGSGDVPTSDSDNVQMSQASSASELLDALESSNGQPFTVENIASRALRDAILLEEYHSISRIHTRRYLVEVFIEALAKARNVSDKRKDGLRRIVSPQLPYLSRV